MVGMRLEFKGTAYTAPRNVMGNLRLAIAKAGLQLRDFVLAPLAYSKTLLADGQQEFGTIVLDMGAGQTTATVVHDNQIKFLSTFPAGGDNISRDISAVLEIGLHDADMLKLDSGLAMASLAKPDNHFMIQKVSEEQPEQLSEVLLAQIIEARVMQILDKIGEKLNMVGAFELPGGIIVTGGGAALRGIPETIRAVYQTQVKEFVPSDIGLRHPGYAGAWALVNYAAQQTPIQLIVKEALYELPLTTTQQSVISTAKSQHALRQPAAVETVIEQPQALTDIPEATPVKDEKTVKNGKFKLKNVFNYFREYFDD